ncbi:MAG: hypothetical protein GY705_16295 [Bacteroidetes bacterium]|nr:hypothetical protein [Bacteroidota bacterium]
MATISVVLRKQKINKKGEAPIYLRIIKNRKTKYFSLGNLFPKNIGITVKRK